MRRKFKNGFFYLTALIIMDLPWGMDGEVLLPTPFQKKRKGRTPRSRLGKLLFSLKEVEAKPHP